MKKCTLGDRYSLCFLPKNILDIAKTKLLSHFFDLWHLDMAPSYPFKVNGCHVINQFFVSNTATQKMKNFLSDKRWFYKLRLSLTEAMIK